MDTYEATKVVFSRIQALDPDHASKIMGVLLIQSHGDKEMIRLAFGPESLLQAVMAKARKDLGILLPASPTSVAAAGHAPFIQLPRQPSSGRAGGAPSPLSVSSPSSWAQAPPFSRSNNRGGNGNAADEAGADGGEELPSPINGGAAPFYLHQSRDAQFLDDMQLQEQLAFLNDNNPSAFDGGECPSPGPGDGGLFPYGLGGWGPNGGPAHRRSASVNELCLGGAAAAALMLGGGDDAHKFMGRPRFDRAADFASMISPASRQIYLTFPSDSTFREEDVSNYFSIYGPVHDVRIPYQQKRMFGFVTFVYPETVKLILAKGNPHFICDARVLVKPYKEKGKVPDKKQPQGDFSGCTTPTGLDVCRGDPFELHPLGARMLQHSNSANELLLRRKLEEQQAAELQHAIELQSRRVMGLQLLDLKSRAAAAATTAPIPSPEGNVFTSSQPVNTSMVESPPQESGEQLKLSSPFAPEGKVNGSDKEESGSETSPNAGDSDQSAEHNLPDSPFASPTKLAAMKQDGFAAATAGNENASSRVDVDCGSNVDGGGLRPSPLEIPSPRPFFFPMHRLSSDHGAMGM
ncbi:hypothetical protein PR202_gb19750 [Eleusine coracana subsp. coracana]|uniref:RRM domain-containing protein n=1 Tax=Eleusine coracana subsp. coracana TaxID=191504 RepID=A0AAV5F916_ELECO|nr:hypothetical protein PR202_gb19750 [Eleusine coracana subsp. coracana]